MTAIQFLAEWALRSSILILIGALLLRALRVKDPSIRLAAWTAVLCGSLAIPALTAALPKAPLAAMRAPFGRVEAPVAAYGGAAEPKRKISTSEVLAEAAVTERFNWAPAATTIYALVALALLVRLCVGLAMGLRLFRRSRATGQSTEGIEIRESDCVASPVTLGIARPAIVLPGDWRQWDGAKLEAVLAHERSHIRRHDPALQLLSAIHRVLLWHTPLSWFLHRRIVRTAEEVSDDAAVAATSDRAFYAEVLLDFMRRRALEASLQGVPMARYGRADERIHRILDGILLSRGVTRWSLAVILALGLPLACLVAAAYPQSSPQHQAAAAPVQATTERPTASDALPVEQSSQNLREVAIPGGRLMTPQVVAQSASAARPQPAPVYLAGLGSVTAFYTVTVRPRVDGQLMSVSFEEGKLVHAGQVLASIDPSPYQVQVAKAEGQFLRDQATLKNARNELDRLEKLVAQNAIPKPQIDAQIATVAEVEGGVRSDQASVEQARLQLSYAQVTAPITGIAGLRLVDPGNIVHAADATGLLIITQLEPIAVLFSIPEDNLPQVRARLSEGANLTVEAWNRDNSGKIATGRLTAVDNQIDMQTGTAKLKAVFENADGALFPNQFVNVRLLLNAK